MYKVGDKVFIEAEIVEVDKKDTERPYRIKTKGYDGVWVPAESLYSPDTILITSEGKTVTARQGNKKAIARCSPEDKFSLETGASLAMQRLLKPNLALKRDGVAYIIGTKMKAKDSLGFDLYSGDEVVFIDKHSGENLGSRILCGYYDAMTDKIIIRVHSYKDLKVGDKLGDVEVVEKKQ